MTEAALRPGSGQAAAGLVVERLDGGAIARLTIARPERGNSLTRSLLEALESSTREMAASGVRAAILTGAGEKAFSTGYDVEALQAELTEAAAGVAFEPAKHPLERALAAIAGSPVPFVAAVRGAASGAGFELACACDLRVVGRGARFLTPPARLGVVYSATGIARIAALTGAGAARELFLLAEPLPAARADALGLVTRLVEDADVDATALALARRLAENAPLSMAGLKAALGGDPGFEALRARAFASADLAEGIAAFLEKRRPVFRGV